MTRAALGRVDKIEKETKSAAYQICNNPSTLLEESLDLMEQSKGSSVVFLRRTPEGSVTSDEGKRFIPTPHLQALIEEQHKRMSNRAILDLFYALSSHALMRGAAGWAHERSIHERLANGGADLSISASQGLTKMPMRSSTRILSGTLAGLKEAGRNDSFYWIPSAANFPGIDGVLGDTDGNVYTVQATIASHHTSPVQGIKKVWEQLKPVIRTERTWHFVIITDTKTAIDTYVRSFSGELSQLTLGATHIPVRFWTCALREQ
jgi:hypothetical protein